MTAVVQSSKQVNGNDGKFRRSDSQFRDFVSQDSSAKFPAEKDRYVLYLNYGCPWAHRTALVRTLKGLEDVVQLVLTDFVLTDEGWLFTGLNGSAEKDPLYGFTCLKQLYLKADPKYQGRYSVPCLWDKKTETIVNNESSEIIRIFYTAFDHLLPESERETNRPGGGFYPPHLRPEIDVMNEWVYHTINNGVYKTGFATSQEAYDANIHPLFDSLNRMETHLSSPSHQPFLFGKYLTEADIRLFTTIIRFDAAYHTIFMCNLKSIRHDYPHIYLWLRRLYWDDTELTKGAFKTMTDFYAYKYGYTRGRARQQGRTDKGSFIVPRGPTPDVDELRKGEMTLVQAVEAELAKPSVNKSE